MDEEISALAMGKAPVKEAVRKAEAAIPPSGIGETLSRVIFDGKVGIGVNKSDNPGLIKKKGKSGKYDGIEADIAEAIAAAVFDNWRNPHKNIKFVPCDTTTRFTYLNLPPGDPNHIDVTVRGVTYNSGRDMDREGTGFELGPIYHYDGTNIMIDTSRAPVGGMLNIIVGFDTSNQTDLERLFAGPYPSNWNPPIIHPGKTDGAREAFIKGEYLPTWEAIHGFCSDFTTLYATRRNNRNPSSWQIGQDFPAGIGKSPLGVAVKESGINGDQNWRELVRWVVNVLKQADEDGYTKNQARSGYIPAGWENPEVPGGYLPEIPGLNKGSVQYNPDWMRDVIAAVGNYAEIWDRNFPGEPRGYNHLWTTDPGLHMSPVFGYEP
jgi:general L-amino acid transport system substrate-binding protein